MESHRRSPAFTAGSVSRTKEFTARVETVRTRLPSVRRERTKRPPVSSANPGSMSESKWKMRWMPSTAQAPQPVAAGALSANWSSDWTSLRQAPPRGDLPPGGHATTLIPTAET